MNDHSEPEDKKPSPLDDLLLEGNETIMMPEGAHRIKRMMAEARDEERTTVQDVKSVKLVIRGMTTHVHFGKHNDMGVVLGRIDPRSGERPDIDLTPMGAAQRGVSRAHARLEYRDEQLWLTDLGSANGTFVGVTQLAPNQATKLYKGDQFLLGRLAVQINFE
jgi:hypothetical protein